MTARVHHGIFAIVDIATIDVATILREDKIMSLTHLLNKSTMSDPDTIYTLLKEIYLIIDDGDRRLLNRFGLTVPRFYVLFHLGNQPGMSLRELSEQMLCDKSNITRIIKGMVSEKLVKRQPHESDGRMLRIYLTDKGREIRETVMALHNEYNQIRFDSMDENLNPDDLYKTLVQVKGDLVETLPEAMTVSITDIE
ncbi:MAG TPA: MarR family transcriptional regulator [Anaerolineae bacterium]|nr:MarR family transcriptional regulator [Anaerolineae bacterium]